MVFEMDGQVLMACVIILCCDILLKFNEKTKCYGVFVVGLSEYRVALMFWCACKGL